MKLKLDENLVPSAAAVFRGAGHDVLLTVEQGLGGEEDRVLIEVCRAEERILVTLDLDFASILNFPPQRYRGIAVLRLPKPISLNDLGRRKQPNGHHSRRGGRHSARVVHHSARGGHHSRREGNHCPHEAHHSRHGGRH